MPTGYSISRMRVQMDMAPLTESDSTSSIAPSKTKSAASSISGTGLVQTHSGIRGKDLLTSSTTRCTPAERILMSLTFLKPKYHKAKILVWTDLSFSTMDRLKESSSADQTKQVLADLFMLGQYKTSCKEGIVMDLFYNTLVFAKGENFSSEKTSALFSIIKNIYEVCIESPFQNKKSIQGYFKELLLCHSSNCPPFSTMIFSYEDGMKITSYVYETFFRHFDMYKYAFTPLIELDLKFNYVGMSCDPQSSKAQYAKKPSSDDMSTVTDTKRLDSIAVEELEEELRNEIKAFLSQESKRIEQSMDTFMKTVTETLQNKLMETLNSQIADCNPE